MLYNNQHFISDVIWGAPMGFFIGKWMLENRSSKYHYVNGVPERTNAPVFVGVMPWSGANGTEGLSLTWTW